MSDVNEFNVETQEFVLRPYTDEEIEINDAANNKDTSEYEVSKPIVLSQIQLDSIASLMDLGLTEDAAKKIIGVA